MATSLQTQLKQLAAPQTDQFLRTGRKRASLLFDPSEAAKYDFKDIYGIGLSGLQELQLLNESFHRYESVLFSEVSQSIERSVQTREVNQKLDTHIGEFLNLLSPYLLLRPALKALEWLIVRFHIHQYNVDQILLAIFPYHETNIFTRIVQLLEFHNTKWEWLKADIQRKKRHLEKAILLKHLSKHSHSWLLSLFCQEISRRAGELDISVHSGNNMFLKFFASTVLSLLSFPGDVINNELIAILVPSLEKCLASRSTDFRLTGFAIIASLTEKVKLEEKQFGKLVLVVGRATARNADENGIKTLSIMLTAHNRAELPEGFLKLFVNEDGFLDLFVKCVNLYELKTLLWIVLKSVVEELFDAENAESACGFLLKMLRDVNFENGANETDESLNVQIATHLIMETVERIPSVTQIGLPIGRCLAHIRELIPRTWNTLLKTIGSKNNHILERLDLTFIKEADAIHLSSTSPTTALFLRLNHPNSTIRLDAVADLLQIFPTDTDFSPEFVREMLLDRFRDEDGEVVERLLHSPEVLQKYLADDLESLLVSVLSDSVRRENLLDTWNRVESGALVLLQSSSGRPVVLPFLIAAVFYKNPEVATEVFAKAFPAFATTFLMSRVKSSPCALLQSVVDNLVHHAREEVIPAADYFCQLFKATPDFPATTAFLTITVLVEALGMLGTYFTREKATVVIDSISDLVARIDLSGRDLTPDPVEQGLRLIKKKKLCSALVVSWCARLWSTSQQVHDSHLSNALLRSARFVLDDSAVSRDHVLQRCLAVVFGTGALRDVATVRLLLMAAVENPKVKCSLVRNIVALCAERVSVLKKEMIPDVEAKELFAVIAVCLRHEDARLRKKGLMVLKNLLERHKFRSTDGPQKVEPFLNDVYKGRDRIEMDGLAISEILAGMFTPKLKLPMETFLLDFLLYPVLDSKRSSLSKHLKLKFLIVLRLVPSFNLFRQLLGAMNELITRLKSLAVDPEVGVEIEADEVRILNEYLERYSPTPFNGLFPMDPEAEKTAMAPLFHSLALPGKFDLKGALGVKEAPAEVILRQMFFWTRDQLGRQLFDKILQEILTIHINKENPSCDGAFRCYLKRVRVPAQLIVEQLSFVNGVPSKKSNAIARLKDPNRRTKAFWIRIAAVLEVFVAKKKVTDIRILVNELFELAKETVFVNDENAGDDNKALTHVIEQVRRLIFCTINFHYKRMKAGDHAEDDLDILLKPDVCHVPAIVDCIRRSNDVQTHLSALALLATLAELMPIRGITETRGREINVLSNCMSIFTLTGDKDQFSMEIAGRTIDVIIPVMLKANEADQLNTIREIMQLFIDALPQTPAQRRNFLFQRLSKVVDSEKNWWILGVMLLNTYVAKNLSIESAGEGQHRKSYPELYEFLDELFGGMSAEAQVRNLAKTAKYIVVASSKAFVAEEAQRKKTKTGHFEKPLTDGSFSSTQLIRLNTAMATFIAQHLSGHVFLSALNETDSSVLDVSLGKLLRNLLKLQSYQKDQGQKVTKEKELLSAATSVAITETMSLISWESFVRIVLNILSDPSRATTKTALEQLGGCLNYRPNFTPADVPHLIPLVGALVEISEQRTDTATPHSSAILRGCLFCLQKLVRILGKESTESWTMILSVSLVCLASDDLSIRSESLNCLAGILVTVKTALIPRLPELLPKLFAVLRGVLPANHSDAFAIISAVDVLDSLIGNLVKFLNPYLPELLRLLAVCSTMRVKEHVRESFSLKLTKMKAVICEDVEFRILFVAVKKTYEELCTGLHLNAKLGTVAKLNGGTTNQDDDPRLLRRHLFLLFNESLKKAKTAEVLAMQRDLVEFLFVVFDRREDVPEALDALSLITLRMGEVSFKGLFMRVYQWATQDGASERRLLTFYQIVNHLTAALKHLFTIFAPTVLPHAVEVMNSLNVAKEISKRIVFRTEDSIELLRTIFDVLVKFFQYDAAGFFDSQQFDLLMQPLVDQLENFDEPISYGLLNEKLLPAIVGFALALNDDSLWKPLHYQVCLKTRNETAEVRIAALRTIEMLAEKLDKSYESLLPEATTFLVELSADDDERVEEQCLKTKVTLERVLGDSTIWRNEME